jgi:hypothetical protein
MKFSELSLQERIKLTKQSILDELKRNDNIHPVNTYLNTQYLLEILTAAEEKEYFEGLFNTYYNRFNEYINKTNELQSDDKIICPYCNSDEHISYDIAVSDDIHYDIAYCEKCNEIVWEEDHDY